MMHEGIVAIDGSRIAIWDPIDKRFLSLQEMLEREGALAGDPVRVWVERLS